MPEIKHNFTRGRMNKDLDERLIPNGEYRDAMNIQVSSSEESNVGTVQNILGNTLGCPAGFVSNDAFTVGSIADEKNDSLYWLVSNQSYSSLANIVSNANNLNIPIILSDEILRKIPSTDPNVSGCERVFVDKFAFSIPNSSTSNSNVLTSIPSSIIEEINIGWSVTGVNSSGAIAGPSQIVSFNQTPTYFATYGFTALAGTATQTSYIDTGLQGMANVIGTSINVPLTHRAVGTLNQPQNNSIWDWDGNGYNLLIGGWDNNVLPSSIVGGVITLNYQSTNPAQPYQETRTILAAQILTYTSTTSSGLTLSSNVCEITLDQQLPQAFNAKHFSNPGGTVVTPPQSTWLSNSQVNGSDVWLGNLMDYSLYPSLPPTSPINATITTTAPTNTNVSNGVFSFNINDLDVSTLTLNQLVNVTGPSSQNPGGSFCIDFIDPANNSIVLKDCNTGTIIGGWQVGGMLFGSPQPPGGLVSLASQQTINLNEPLDLSSGQFQALIFSGPRALNFNHGNLVTGLNIVDDMLFWTDNRTEPKKINITRSVEGTVQNGTKHTSIVNNKLNYGLAPGTYIPAREEHITVIKKPPTQAPGLDMVAKRLGNSFGNAAYDFTSTAVGDEITINVNYDATNGPNNYAVDDVLYLNQGITRPAFDYDFDVRLVINNITIFATQIEVEATVLSIKEGLSYAFQTYFVSLDTTGEKLYSLKFPRFAIRYKYEDGEYSSYGPFSEVAFLPGEFGVGPESQFLPNRGYNLGMENKLTDLKLINIIQNDLPFDVVQVDILYKESNSTTVYTIDEIKPSDAYWTNNAYNIKKETIKATLPSNQLLRPWDNVPKKALSQELTGNRIIYGNYEQNYNLYNYRANFTVRTKQRDNIDTKKSVKSLRNYQLGVIYCDKYNRQTPVLSDATGSIRIEKLDSDKRNQLEVSLNSNYPLWATHYKLYLKETSTEYYNLSLDRYFEAKDENIWLAFPSSDRNKLDLETSLYLKKRYNSSSPEQTNEKYKVIDIKDEAPEYIKTRRVVLGGVQDDANAQLLFDDANFLPTLNSSQFKIRLTSLDNTLLENFHEQNTTAGNLGGSIVSNTIFIRFSSADVNGVRKEKQTQWYEVDNVKKTEDFYYFVKIKEKFTQEDSWITNDVLGPGLADITNTAAGGFGLVFEVGQDIVQNKSIFQGRFFAKILKSNVVEEAIVAQGLLQNQVAVASIQAGRLINFQEERPDGVSANYQQVIGLAISQFNDLAGNGFPWFAEGAHYKTNPTAYSSTDYGPPDGAAGQVSNKAYWSREAWKRIYKQLDSADSKWVLDEAFSAGEEPRWRGIDQSNEQVPPALGPYPGSGSTIYGGYNLNSSNPKSIDFNARTTVSWMPPGLAYQDGKGHGSPGVIVGGVLTNSEEDYEYHTTGQGLNLTTSTFDLSYVGTGRLVDSDFDGASINTLAYAANPNSAYQTGLTIPGVADWNDHWKILDDVDSTAKNFADKIQVGSYLKFTNDPTEELWKITNVRVFYKYNYSDYYKDVEYPDFDIPVPGSNPPESHMMSIEHHLTYKDGTANDTWSPNPPPASHTGGVRIYDQLYNMAYYNRRITYRITVESADNPGSKLGDNPNYTPWITDGSTISSSRCGIDIISLDYIDNNNDVDFPENPAIFETEPKEDVDLNIYHEASDTIPVSLSNNGIQFAPTGSVVKSLLIQAIPSSANLSTPAPGVENIIVNNWLSNGIVEINGEFLNPTLDDTFSFTRPDGTYTVAKFISLGDGDSSSIISTPQGPQSSFAKFEIVNTIGLGWHNCFSFGNGVESNRIRDAFNSVFIDKGPKVSATLDENYKLERRGYGLIYSGIYNSNSGINNLNQFVMAEKITKDINPTYGSIQKLHAGWGQSGDLIALCEDRILKILANKDALFNADGNTNVTATNKVLGTATPYSGKFGISKNPESFASESYRAYFTDKVRGAILRLSRDGLTPISEVGMKDYFRDNLKLNNKLVGSFDDRKGEYNITLQQTNAELQSARTVSFKEKSKGWVSFKSFAPEQGISCANKYYTFNQGALYEHHVPETVENRNTFYGDALVPSTFTVIFNESPGSIKDFYTINYEGSQGRMNQITNYDTFVKSSWDGSFGANGEPVYTTTSSNVTAQGMSGYNLQSLNIEQGWYVSNIQTDKEEGSIKEFIEKEGKWFNYIKGKEWL